MAGKDLSEKKLEDYNDVFADILNTLLFKKMEFKIKIHKKNKNIKCWFWWKYIWHSRQSYSY